MINQLAIVVLIDVEVALKQGNLQGCTYLVDNYRFKGSTGQGTGQLRTKVIGCNIMNWLITGLDYSGNQPMPALFSIGGEAVDKQIMVPQLFDSPALGDLGLWWGATVDAQVAGTYRYTLGISLGAAKMEYESSVYVEPGFTMETTTMAASQLKAAPVPRMAISGPDSLLARATADGSLMNPDDHVSLFSKIERDKMRALLNRR